MGRSKITINQKLLADIEEYCEENDLEANTLINNLLQKSFMVLKYGEAPPFLNKKTVEEEIIKRENAQEVAVPPIIEEQEKPKKSKKKIITY